LDDEQFFPDGLQPVYYSLMLLGGWPRAACFQDDVISDENSNVDTGKTYHMVGRCLAADLVLRALYLFSLCQLFKYLQSVERVIKRCVWRGGFVNTSSALIEDRAAGNINSPGRSSAVDSRIAHS